MAVEGGIRDERRGDARPAGRLPDDPAAFVAEAERVTNATDLAALETMYAADAVFENTADGVFERYRGGASVVEGWRALLTVAGRSGIDIHKTLLTVGDDWIVNDWAGTMGGRPVRGLEAWRFDADGKVDQHRIYSTLSARPSTDVRARLRAVLNYPAFAVRLLLAQRRFRARPTGERS